MVRRKHHRISYFTSSFATVLGLVLIWRGIWYVMDWIDAAFLGGDHIATVLGGLMFGMFILYLPDRNLDELRKL